MNLEALNTLMSGAHRPRKGSPCGAGLLLAQLAEKEPEALPLIQQAIDNATIPATALADYLAGEGYQIASFTLRRHRNRRTQNGCRCE